MEKTGFFLPMLFVSTLLFSENASDVPDITGYLSFQWGDKVEKVLEKFKDCKEDWKETQNNNEDSFVCTADIEMNIKINQSENTIFSPYAQRNLMFFKNKLFAVTIHYEIYSYRNTQDPLQFIETFSGQFLILQLIEKYGQKNLKEYKVNSQDERILSWNFPSTLIEANITSDTVSITYLDKKFIKKNLKPFFKEF